MNLILSLVAWRDIEVLPRYLAASLVPQVTAGLARGSGIICREKYRPDAREKREYVLIISAQRILQLESREITLTFMMGKYISLLLA